MSIEGLTSASNSHYLIFLCYRRNDRPGYVARLCDDINARFGDVVFRDVDSITAGDQWQTTLKRQIGQSRVVLALIGERWLAELQSRDSTTDHVRLELNYAHELDVAIMPVLLDDAELPDSDALGDLSWLSNLQGHGLSDRQRRWQFDVERLLTTLASKAQLVENTVGQPTDQRGWQDKKWWISAVAIILLVTLVLGVLYTGSDTTVDATNGVAAGGDVNVDGDITINNGTGQ